MIENENIEELFRDSFESFKPSVDPSVWQGIQSSLAAKGLTTGAAVTKTIFGISKLYFISGAAILLTAVTAVTAGYFLGKASSVDDPIFSSENKREVVSTVCENQERNEDSGIKNELLSEDNQTLVSNINQNDKRISQNSTKEKSFSKDVEDEINSSGVDQFLTQTGKTYYWRDNEQNGVDEGNDNSDSKTTSKSVTNESKNDDLKESIIFKPELNITVHPQGGSGPLHVSFLAEGNFKEITWNFDDGYSSSEKNPVHVFYEPGNYSISAEAIYKDGSVKNVNKIIEVHEGSSITPPNIVTPNSDGENDALRVLSKEIEQFQVVVYNSMGEVLFESRQVDFAWDCTVNGNLIPKGTYTMHITALGKDGRKFNSPYRFYVNY